MIRNAVIHIANEQPLLADLYTMPTALDTSLVCTNIRMLDGKKPIFIDHAELTFFFPYLHIRFIEIQAGSVTGLADDPPSEVTRVEAALAEDPEADGDLELDEDFLRRIREA